MRIPTEPQPSWHVHLQDNESRVGCPQALLPPVPGLRPGVVRGAPLRHLAPTLTRQTMKIMRSCPHYLSRFDDRRGSHNSRYVKSFVEDAGAALLRPDLPAPSCECYRRRRSACRPPNGTRHHDFRQRPADDCHGWYRAPTSQPLTTPGPSHLSNAIRRRRVIRPASRCLRRPSRGRMPCWKDADEPAQTSCLL